MKKIFFFSIKHELLSVQQKRKFKKAKDRYCKEKAAEYYLNNKEKLKEKPKDRYKNLPEKEKNEF